MALIELQPTSTALWYKLVCEAQANIDIRLEQELESYLVFLLMRFTDKPKILSNIMAIDYLNGQLAGGNVRHEMLRDVGDQCLLFSGLFPNMASRRRVRLDYYIDLGRGAYLNLSDTIQSSFSDVYAQLSHSFVSLMDVLQVIRNIDDKTQSSHIPYNFTNAIKH